VIVPIPIQRFAGMNTRNDVEQLEATRANSARNVSLGRQLLESRRGYVKATKAPVFNRSTQLKGLETGILSSKLPLNLSQFWSDGVGSNRTKITLQVRVQGIELDSVGETDIPYSLDYGGQHQRPNEDSELITPGAPYANYTIYKRDFASLGDESDDAKLWKPPAATNRYDTTAHKKYPWVPGNSSAVSLADAAKVRPKLACVLATGPLREFPCWHLNNSQKTWASQVAGGVPSWLNSYFTNFHGAPAGAGALRYPAPFANATNVGNGYCDPGDLYVFYVWSPFTQQWHLMVLWEYSDPGIDATTGFNVNGMNRMFAFAGWGTQGSNIQARAIDPTLPHTITVALERDFTAASNSRLEIGVDGNSDGLSYGEVSSQPLPAANAAPTFGLQELSGLFGINTKRNRPAWRGRTLYLGGIPKASNQRGVYGYGCGQSVNRGGMEGVTCPFPGAYSELRMFAGAFKFNGASDAGANPDDGFAIVLGSGMSGLGPGNSRAIKRKAAGAAWDHAQDPTSVPYTGTVNIWRLDAVAGDIFDPLYKLAGTTATTGFKTGGLAAAGNFVQDFHAFEPVNNGASVAPGTVGASSGSARFNGGTPAFSLAAAQLRRDRGGQTVDVSGEPKTAFDLLQPPLEQSFIVIYRPTVAPETEPASIAGTGTGDVPYPGTAVPQAGEVHTLAQLMSPNREGKTTTSWSSSDYGVDPLGFTQGFAQGFDHPDGIWAGSVGTAPSPIFQAPGRKDLELARLDLVAHQISTVAGTPTADQLETRYVLRSDFGYGSDFAHYELDGSSDADKSASKQQRGCEKFFRHLGIAAAGSIAQDAPYDSDDDYFFLDSDVLGDDAYCYMTLCKQNGTPISNPKDLEGRVYAIQFGYQISQPTTNTDKVVGKQSMRVWDITDPGNVFECAPSAAAMSRKVANCGMSWAASRLFGVGRYVFCLGGKLQPQGGEWWMGGSVYPTPIDPDAYPYGCWPLGTNPDTRNDPRSLAAGAGMVSNGAKGSFDGAFWFGVNLGGSEALAFVKALLAETNAWQGLVPRDALALVRGRLKAAWLCDMDGGHIISDSVGGLHMGLDDAIPLETTTGKTQAALQVNTTLGGLTAIPVHRNAPFTYNAIPNGRMFPDRLRPVRQVNTGRLDSLFGDDDFTAFELTMLVGHPESVNVQPSPEPLLAVVEHVGRSGQNEVVVATKTSILRYDPAGDGTLKRVEALRQHFTDATLPARDAVDGRTLLQSPSADPVMIDADGQVVGTAFIERPLYAVPEIWARDLTPAEKALPENSDTQKWPIEFNVAYETTLPRSPTILGVERIEGVGGLKWVGEMQAPVWPVGGPFTPAQQFSPGVGIELVQWGFFITYWSDELQNESQPGRAFAWSNGLPMRVPTYGVFASGSNPDDPYTGEPNTKGLVTTMRGTQPPSHPTAGHDGTPKVYNIRLHNVPLPADPKVSHIRVYRTTLNGSVFFLEDEFPVAAGDAAKGGKTTLLIGTKDDISLVQPQIGGLASKVPNGARFAASYQGREFYAGFPWAPQRVVFSYQGRPTSVPFFYYVELGSNNAPITAMFCDADRLYVFKEDSVYIGICREWDVFDLGQASQGLPVSFELTQLEAGAVGHRAVCSVPEKGIAFAGDASVFLMSGMQVLRVSAPIDGEEASDYVPGSQSDALAQVRVVYPFAFDTDHRERWRMVYYAPLRAVFLCPTRADSKEPTLVLFTDLMDWVFWTDYRWDDIASISRFGSAASELWGIRDSRLWRLDQSAADGLDYLCPNLAGNQFTSGATNLTQGTLVSVGTTFAANDDYKLSLTTASLPAAYQALLNTAAVELRAKDLLRGAYLTIYDQTTGLSTFRRRIRFAYSDGTNVHVVLPADDLPGSPGVAGNVFRVGTIDGHWVSGLVKPGDGDQLAELQRLNLQRTEARVTLGGSDFRGQLDLLFDYGDRWPSLAKDSVPGTAALRTSIGGFRGRDIGFMFMLAFKGAYSPIGVSRGKLVANLMRGQGAYG
jgi:hypothetical protein